MDRRDFIKSLSAASLAALVPTWWITKPKPFNLQEFCAVDPMWKWKMTSPFTQQVGDKFCTYATDARIIVKVDGDWQKDGTDDEKTPPAERLAWDHDTERGWRPWPKEQYIEKPDAKCIACRGRGGDGHRKECETCDGVGEEWIGTYEYARPIKCRACDGIGVAKPHCKACKGNGLCRGPDVQVLGHTTIGAEYDMLIRRECPNAEYVIVRRKQMVRNRGRDGEEHDVVLFRFAQGTGMLVPRTPIPA